MKLRTQALALSGTLAVSLFAYNTVGLSTPTQPKLKPVVATEAHYIDYEALITALTETPELIGVTGTAKKTVGYKDSKWYGDKEYKMTVKGTFKLGIATDDLEVITKGNTVTVRLPQTKIIAVDFPFDIADIKKDVGRLRNDLDEVQLQALYGEARSGAIAKIKADEEAFDKAEKVVKRSIGKIIVTVANKNEVRDVKINFGVIADGQDEIDEEANE